MINEKTLELNISNELLTYYRLFDPKAISLGISPRREASLGYDSRILGTLPPSFLMTLYQYKAPLRMKQTQLGNGFLFHLNDSKYKDQHLILWVQTGGRVPQLAYYVLPCIMNLNNAYNLSPNLLNETYFLDVSTIDPFFIGTSRHDIIVHPRRLIAEIFSDSEKQVDILPFSEIKNAIFNKKGISIKQYRENLRNLKNYNIKSTKFPISCFITSDKIKKVK